jgi:hypothetical protein
MLVGVGSVKGSPGATTLGLGLAARWPARGSVVVEADPAGGDLALRFGQHKEPGLSELAADVRGGATVDLDSYARPLSGLEAAVVFAPVGGEAVASVTLLAASGLDALRDMAQRRLVVADVGRLYPGSPALPLAATCDVLLLVSTPAVEGLDAVAARRDGLLATPGWRASLRLVLVGGGPYPAGEAAKAVGIPLAMQVPADRRGAAVLSGRALPPWGWSRLELLRAARSLALGLHRESRHRSELDTAAVAT